MSSVQRVYHILAVPYTYVLMYIPVPHHNRQQPKELPNHHHHHCTLYTFLLLELKTIS